MGGREGEDRQTERERGGTGDKEVCVEDGEKKKKVPKRPDREM